jgi:hypothetical protein
MSKVFSVVVVGVLAVAPLLFSISPASAWVCPNPGESPPDFLTGGGFIINATGATPGAHANFGVGGACKDGGDGHGLWGHLEYIDHGTGLNVHWETITAYLVDVILGDPAARIICGTARTNQFGDGEHFAVRAADHGEPGRGVDQFDILVTHTDPGTGTEVIDYQTNPNTFPQLLAGGNIQLHKPIKITTTFNESCPALAAIGISI